MTRKATYMIAIGAFLPTAVAIVLWFVVPKFARVYSDFGAELPAATRLLLNTYRWWVLVPALIVFAGFNWPQSKNGPLPVLVAGIVLGVAMLVFGGWACYLPIFHLGATS